MAVLAAILASAAALHAQSAKPASAGDSSIEDLLTRGQSDMDGQDYAAAAKDYEQYIAQKPDDPVAHFQLGYAYTALQRLDDARTQYQRATELDPQMGSAFLNLGLAEMGNDPGTAVASLRKAVELMPDDARAMAALARALERSGKVAEAMDDYKAAEALDSDDLQIRFALGSALLRAHRTSDAEAEFRASLVLDADDPQSHLGLGETLMAEKNFAQGADELAIYLKAYPSDVAIRAMRASALIDANKYEDALAELDQANALAPTTLQLLKLRYEALFSLKRNDEAAAALVKAEALAPGDPEIHFKLAQAYLGKKDFQSAERELQALLKITPNDADAASALVSAAYEAGDYAGAVEAVNLQIQQLRQTPLPLQTMFIRASSWDKMGKKAVALDAYEAFLAANKDQTSDMYFAAAQRARELRKELGNR